MAIKAKATPVDVTGLEGCDPIAVLEHVGRVHEIVATSNFGTWEDIFDPKGHDYKIFVHGISGVWEQQWIFPFSAVEIIGVQPINMVGKLIWGNEHSDSLAYNLTKTPRFFDVYGVRAAFMTLYPTAETLMKLAIQTEALVEAVKFEEQVKQLFNVQVDVQLMHAPLLTSEQKATLFKGLYGGLKSNKEAGHGGNPLPKKGKDSKGSAG